MNDEQNEGIERVLDKFDPARRQFLQRLLLGGGAIVLIASPASILLAQAPVQDAGKGKDGGIGKGEGGKGKG